MHSVTHERRRSRESPDSNIPFQIGHASCARRDCSSRYQRLTAARFAYAASILLWLERRSAASHKSQRHPDRDYCFGSPSMPGCLAIILPEWPSREDISLQTVGIRIHCYRLLDLFLLRKRCAIAKSVKITILSRAVRRKQQG